MLPIHAWLKRANPRNAALVLPDGSEWHFGELVNLSGLSGLQVLVGETDALARGIVATAIGGGTAFPMASGLNESGRSPLVELALPAANSQLPLIIATSGSTGAPKGVCLSWRAVASASRISGNALHLGPGDCWLACLPLYHIGGAMVIYRCLRAGATCLLHRGFSANGIAREIQRRPITHISLVPPMLARLLDAGIKPAPTLRHALVGGAALSRDLFQRALAAGWPICPTYGMTETCAQATINLHPGVNWCEGDVGLPLPGVRCAIAANGTIRISTPARMRGYLGEINQTSDWISTHDMGHIDAEGHVHVSGRADEMLISGGVNVHPLEVELALAGCPGLREAGVTGIEDPLWGSIVSCVYEGDASESAVAQWSAAQIAKNRQPRQFMRVDKLPRTASGKLDRRALKSLWNTTS